MEQNLGNKGVVWATLGGEMISVAFELRYMIIFSFILILTDFWWGYNDSMKRLSEAKEANDAIGIEKYKWHKSRAIRRTANKAVDMLTYLLLGAFFGLAITEPLGWGSHVYTAAFALAVGCFAEIASIIGHYSYVKFGVEIKVIDAWRWLVKLLVNILKIKSKDLGEAVDNTIHDTESNMED